MLGGLQLADTALKEAAGAGNMGLNRNWDFGSGDLAAVSTGGQIWLVYKLYNVQIPVSPQFCVSSTQLCHWKLQSTITTAGY